MNKKAQILNLVYCRRHFTKSYLLRLNPNSDDPGFDLMLIQADQAQAQKVKKPLLQLAFLMNLVSPSSFASPVKAKATDIVNLAKSGQAKNIGEFLNLLPESLRRSFTLMYDSNSLHGSSPLAPRAIMFNWDGSLFVTFNGDPDQRGYESVEIAGFDQNREKVEYQEIMFKADLKKGNIGENRFKLRPDDVDFESSLVTVSKVNPRKCLSCHSTGNFNEELPNKERIARYIWSDYPNWPGAYGGHDDFYSLGGTNQHNTELDKLKQFRAASPEHDRYKALIFDNTKSAPYCSQFRSEDYRCRRNFHMTVTIAINQARQLAKQALDTFGRAEAVRYLSQVTGAPGNHEPTQALGVSMYGKTLNSINELFETPESYNSPIKYFDRRSKSTPEHPSKEWYAGYESFLSQGYKGELEAYFTGALFREIAKSDKNWSQKLNEYRAETYSAETPEYRTFTEDFRDYAKEFFLDVDSVSYAPKLKPEVFESLYSDLLGK